MQKGINLQELAKQIEANKEMKMDFVVPTQQATMQIQSDKTPVVELEGHGTFPVRPLAHDQLGGRLGIPSKYYDRMLKEQPDLLAINVNTWFKSQPEKRMFRTLGGDLRSVNSNRYQRIENEEIAEVTLPILFKIPQVQIISCQLTETRMYIQAVSPRVQGKVGLNDIVQAGVAIGNSEVGCGAASVSPLVYRLKCLNGMILPDQKFRAYHVGRRIEDNEDLWKDDTKKADDKAILLKVRDMIERAIDDVNFAKTVDKMNGLTQVEIKGDPTASIEVLAKKIGASEEEKGGILNALIKGGDLSAWGVLNAVTAQAHTSKNYDRAVDLETTGGQLLELPRSQWKEILEAA